MAPGKGAHRYFIQSYPFQTGKWWRAENLGFQPLEFPLQSTQWCLSAFWRMPHFGQLWREYMAVAGWLAPCAMVPAMDLLDTCVTSPSQPAAFFQAPDPLLRQRVLFISSLKGQMEGDGLFAFWGAKNGSEKG